MKSAPRCPYCKTDVDPRPPIYIVPLDDFERYFPGNGQVVCGPSCKKLPEEKRAKLFVRRQNVGALTSRR